MVTRKLPSPLFLSMPITEVFGKRRSTREFSAEPLSPELLSTLLWSTAGKTDELGHRTVPSAKGAREIDAYVFDKDGVWRYDEVEHQLIMTNDKDMRGETTLAQGFVKDASVTLVFAADDEALTKLDPTRTDRCAAIDAGCMAFAAQLAATAMGMPSVIRASVHIEKTRRAIGLANVTPLLAITVSMPKL